MSDTSDVVLVEHTDVPTLISEDAADTPQAFNIVSIGSQENEYAFTFHQDKLREILGRVPKDAKVAVVSVVGAFRTGKSFLLSWFLRYLHYLQQQQNKHSAGSDTSDSNPWYEQVQSLGNKGFHWRAGSERDTTGIWMWSHPQVFERDDSSPLAILMVDTQGMFDHETTMSLTASIFGFSTLLSSYQVYNVDKRIQEDDLQQLALFSEFAKIAVESDLETEEEEEEEETKAKPFQKVEFLVRDWQHFDEVEDDEEEPNFEKMEEMMADYLQKVIAERDAKDLQETRQQIVSCFESISCYGLCHPGFATTKKKFTGDVRDIEPLFLELLDRLCKKVFDIDNMEAKKIHGRELTGPELGAHVEAYAELFASGAKFPTAATLLDATASANNTNAINMAMAAYKNEMDRVAGPHCSNFLKQEELENENKRISQRSIKVFSEIANFGSKNAIEEARQKLVSQIDSSFEVYTSLNEGRNPLAGLETYVIPASMAVVAAVLRWFTDMTCSPYSSVCRTTSEFLSHTSAVVFFFLLIVSATRFKQIKDLLVRLKSALEALSAPPPTKNKRD